MVLCDGKGCDSGGEGKPNPLKGGVIDRDKYLYYWEKLRPHDPSDT